MVVVFIILPWESSINLLQPLIELNLWAIIIIVSSGLDSSMEAITLSSVLLSRALVASSRTKICAFLYKALAIPIRCL